MKRAIVLLSLALSSSAMAKTPKWFTDGASSVDLPGQVDVPLLRGIVTGGAPVVEMTGTADDDGVTPRRLASFSLAGFSVMGDGVVEEFGGKVKTDGNGNKYAIIPEIHLGDLTIRGLRVMVVEPDSQWLTSTYAHIALTTLDGVASAYLPSQGVLRFVAPEEGGNLVGSVADPLTFSWPPEGKQHEHGATYQSARWGVLVPGQVNGTDGLLMLNPSGVSVVDPAYAPATEHTFSGLRFVTVPMTVGGVTYNDEPSIVATIGWSGDDAMPLLGVFGNTELLTSDIAVDPSTMSVAFKAVAAPKWADATDVYLAIAKDAFDNADTKCEGDDCDDKDAEAEDGADEAGEDDGPDEGDSKEVSRHSDYAQALTLAGRLKDALEYRQLATTFAGENCEPYLQYGEALTTAGDFGEGAANLQKAAELYDRWATQDLDTRLAIGRDNAPEGAFTLEQNPSCAVAWGELAANKLRQGDYAGVETLFRAHMDLDADMANTYGASLLQQQKWSDANGAFRRAVNLGGQRSYVARLGVGVANGKAGDVAIFDAQIDRLMASRSNVGDLGGVVAVAFSDEVKGDGAGLALAKRMAENAPWDAHNQLVLAWTLPAGAERTAVLKRADALLQRDEKATANVAWTRFSRSWYQALSGDAKAAQATIDGIAAEGVEFVDFAFFVKSEIARAAGDEAGRKAELSALHTLAPTLPLPAAWTL